ncbi:MAG: DUF3667 domain-containing protein [Gammaproteobacteria bacterium]|nr:DUF3667 domain-containing protein [Gammaproteobacteria bacterium]
MDANFCPQCGQEDVELQRPLFELLGEVLRETFDIDGRAARTIWTMFSQPGVLTARFLAGHRKEYMSPVRLYLVVSVLFFLVVAWVVRQGILFDVGADAAGEIRVLAEDLPTLMFIFLPVFALLLKVAFRQRFYFDHLIHALHLHTAAYVALALLLPLERAANQHWLLLIVQLALFAYLAGHLAISFRRVYGATWVATAIKVTAILFGYTAILATSLEFAGSLK